METESDKKRIARISPNKKQAAWNYMRRNRNFRVGDVMIISALTSDGTHSLIYSLEKAGYIRLKNPSMRYEDRIYTLVKATGAQAPTISRNDVYDHNTKQTTNIKMPPKNRRQEVEKAMDSLAAMGGAFCLCDVQKVLKDTPKNTIRWATMELLKAGAISVAFVEKSGTHFYKKAQKEAS